MPIHEYTCANGHTSERFFKSFSEAEATETLNCTVCGETARKGISVPLAAHLYGDPAGYYKPSATQRASYKTVNRRHGNGRKD